ncbi:lipopolysaccharide biosynthesis protein [Streptomyces sp. NPDC052013]|uniref:lipopolysaccharide biosynthesis protein n=1 Tax=Streptomyces sp. NPDC052013 TaxID=3365679 RepID=UPI0037D8DE6D
MAETQVHERAAVRDTDGGHRPAGSGSGSDSLFKNAYFLMLSTGVSAVLGLGFWLVAARYYSEDAVGQGSAAIAAMRLLASITATTMIGAVVRFVPRAGRETGRLVWGVYGASSLVVALAAGVFLLTLDQWGASYAPLGTPLAGALFVAACVAWALLTLQDGVLTGLRKAEWVPAGNAVFSVGKLVLLAVFASALPVLGIFVSWAVAIAFSTLPLGWLIFRRLIPRQAAADRDLEPPRLRDMGRFLAGDSLGALFSLAMINLLPVMVAVRFSAAENGYFYVAYTVGGTMEFMAINMASSLTAHASHDPRQLADGVRGALRRMTLLLVPVVLVLVVFAPQILTPFSADYAEHGSTVLRLLALGALPRVVVELYIGVLRVQGRTGVLAALQGAMCVLVLGSAAVLFTPAGISGAGWAVLISMTLIAVVSVFGLRSALRERPGEQRERPSAAAPVYGTRWARLNATAGYGTGWARRAAYEDGNAEEDGEDTVTLIIGHPGYEREALHSDTVAFIVRPHAREGREGGADPGPVGHGDAAHDRGGAAEDRGDAAGDRGGAVEDAAGYAGADTRGRSAEREETDGGRGLDAGREADAGRETDAGSERTPRDTPPQEPEDRAPQEQEPEERPSGEQTPEDRAPEDQTSEDPEPEDQEPEDRAPEEQEAPGDEAAGVRDDWPSVRAAADADRQGAPPAHEEPDRENGPQAPPEEGKRRARVEEPDQPGDRQVPGDGEAQGGGRRSPWDVVLPAGRPVWASDASAGGSGWERRGPTEVSSPPWAADPPAGPHSASGTSLPSVGPSSRPAGAASPRHDPARPARPAPPTPTGPPSPRPQVDPDRTLRGVLWALLGLATLAFWMSVRALPWLDGAGEKELTGRELLEGMPAAALGAGGVLLLVFVAAVTLCTRPDALLPATALGSALLALHAAPVALGREPAPVDGALYSKTAGFLAEAVGLEGPGPLLRWTPLVCMLLCLVPLWLLLAGAGAWLSWPGRWGVLYLIAVGGWVWRDELAPLTPLLLVALVVLALLLPLGRAAVRAAAGALPDRRQPNDRSRD